MSFGAVIAVKSGDEYVPIDAELESALAEIRVEQYLDSPTTFALRFQEDFDDDQPKLTEHPLFNQSIELVILAPDGKDATPLVCLVRGIVEQVSFDVDIGGSGSAIDVRGRDVRMLLDRVCEPQTHTEVTADTVIERLVSDIPDLQRDIAPGTELYDARFGGPAALNCYGTALEVIEELAEEESYRVWLSYEVGSGLRGISVKTTLHVKPSPDRGGLPALPALISFDKRPDIQLLMGKGNRPNVTTFKIDSDNERIKSVRTSAIDESGGGSSTFTSTSADDKTNPNGAGVEDTGNEAGPLGAPSEEPERSTYYGGPGTPAAVARRAEAMATEASWYIEAEAMTTVHLYGAVLQPHDMVDVVGIGCEWAGKYQVRDVIHVINGADHWMTATLRGNSRGKAGGR